MTTTLIRRPRRDREHDPEHDAGRAGSSLVGNRLVIIGTVLYLAEFVGIGLSGAAHLPKAPGSSTHAIVSAYSGHANGLGFLVGWFGIVGLGRVLVVLGLRRSLQQSGYASTWMDWAVVAMAIGAVMEIASESLAAAAGELAGAGQSTAAVAVDRGAWYLGAAILVPTGLAVVAASVCMLTSRLFGTVLCAIGIIAGVAVAAGGLLSAPSEAGLQDTMTTGVLVMWIWMVWAGVRLWRRTSARAGVASAVM